MENQMFLKINIFQITVLSLYLEPIDSNSFYYCQFVNFCQFDISKAFGEFFIFFYNFQINFKNEIFCLVLFSKECTYLVNIIFLLLVLVFITHTFTEFQHNLSPPLLTSRMIINKNTFLQIKLMARMTYTFLEPAGLNSIKVPKSF